MNNERYQNSYKRDAIVAVSEKKIRIRRIGNQSYRSVRATVDFSPLGADQGRLRVVGGVDG